MMMNIYTGTSSNEQGREEAALQYYRLPKTVPRSLCSRCEERKASSENGDASPLL